LLKTAKCYLIRSYFTTTTAAAAAAAAAAATTTPPPPSVLRQVHSLFQSPFSRMRALVLPLSISVICWFP
jgi:hypothetical protein